MRRCWLLETGLVVVAALPLLVLPGCSDRAPPPKPVKAEPAKEEGIPATRDKLSPEDRALVEEQEFCVISTTQRLGSMGVPYKVMVKDQPVFLCCNHCEKKALADPDKTLATLAAHKKRVKESQAGKEK